MSEIPELIAWVRQVAKDTHLDGLNEAADALASQERRVEANALSDMRLTSASICWPA